MYWELYVLDQSLFCVTISSLCQASIISVAEHGFFSKPNIHIEPVVLIANMLEGSRLGKQKKLKKGSLKLTNTQ